MPARSSGQLVIAVLFEAQKHFGRITDQNRDQVAQWVRRRMAELTQQAAQRDAKAAAAGEQE